MNAKKNINWRVSNCEIVKEKKPWQKRFNCDECDNYCSISIYIGNDKQKIYDPLILSRCIFPSYKIKFDRKQSSKGG